MNNDKDESDFLGSLLKVGYGSHLCLIYENQEEQFATVIPFIKLGLERNEKCVYIADENTIETVTKAMKLAYFDLFTSSLTKGNLLMLTKTNSYLKDGYFSPEKMIRFLKKSTDEAIASGYKGLQVTGEMTWMLAGDPGSEKLIEYEAKLNNFLPGSRACAMCQYNLKSFSDELMFDVFRTHPFVIYKSKIIKNPLYLTPAEFFNHPKKQLVMDNVLERFASLSNL